MSQFKRQHPVAAVTRVLNIIKRNIITIIVVFFLGRSSSDLLSNLLSAAGIIVILLVVGVVSWWRYVYCVEDGELRIEHGVFVRKNIYIPKERIQVIDTTSGFLQRMFGLVSLKVRTASGESGATLDALTSEEAQNISEQLSSEDQVEDLEEESREEKYYRQKRIKTSELVLSAVTSGSIGVIATILGSISSELDTLLSESQIYSIVQSLTGSGWYFILILVFVLLAGSIILAFIGTLVKYARFSIERSGDELIINRGLIEKKQITIPINRIQAIRIEEGLLRQPFGRASVSVSSAGYGDEDGKVTTLFPLLVWDEITHFINEFIPEYAVSVPTVHPPSHAKRRYVFKSLLAGLFVGIMLYELTSLAAVFVVVIPAYLLGASQFRAAAVGADIDILAARYRLLSRKTVLVKKKRIQAVELRQTPIQKYRDLGNLTLSFASGNGGHSFTIREIDLGAGREVFTWSVDNVSEEFLTSYTPGMIIFDDADEVIDDNTTEETDL